MTASSPLISAKGVIKRFGPKTALDGISLDIAPGEFFGLLGPNGAGKSTFMSLVAGLRGPQVVRRGTCFRPGSFAARALRTMMQIEPASRPGSHGVHLCGHRHNE